ncbi:hypothetical protein BDW69DRAFT_29486 [Aspergillus filifer]
MNFPMQDLESRIHIVLSNRREEIEVVRIFVVLESSMQLLLFLILQFVFPISHFLSMSLHLEDRIELSWRSVSYSIAEPQAQPNQSKIRNSPSLGRHLGYVLSLNGVG